MSTAVLASIAVAALAIAFGALYVVARRVNNYGLVDIAWAYAFGFLAGFYALFGPGWAPRRALIASMAIVWSFRLGTYLAIRVLGHHPTEDARYAQLRHDWRENFAAKMFGFFQVQALSVFIFGVAFLVASRHSAAVFHPLEIAGAVLWLASVTGEAVADAQLSAFKLEPDNRNKVCDVGLWRYSRHPNYFFEWLIWVAYFIFALASPWGWLAAVGPAGILWLLLRVTGIPMTEIQSLRSRGDAYHRYQQTTSAFVPWFRREPAPRS